MIQAARAGLQLVLAALPRNCVCFAQKDVKMGATCSADTTKCPYSAEGCEEDLKGVVL